MPSRPHRAPVLRAVLALTRVPHFAQVITSWSLSCFPAPTRNWSPLQRAQRSDPMLVMGVPLEGGVKWSAHCLSFADTHPFKPQKSLNKAPAAIKRSYQGRKLCPSNYCSRSQSALKPGPRAPAPRCAVASPGRRPPSRPAAAPERALLSCAAEVYDLLGATPEGCVLLARLGLDPDAALAALPTHEGLQARLAAHRTGMAARAGA